MSTISTFDRSIRSPLEGLRRRARQAAAARGFLNTLWVLLLLLLGLALTDYLLHLPGPARLICLLGLIGFVLWRLWTVVVSPLSRPLPLDVLAAHMETIDPVFQDRLRSSLMFLSRPHPDQSSSAMEEQVVRQTADMLTTVDLRQAIDRRPLWLSLRRFAAVAAVVLLLVLWQPALVKLALVRLTQPLSSVAWPKSVEIQLLTRMPQSLPVGTQIEYAVKLVRGDRQNRQVVLGYRVGDGPEQKQIMRRNADGQYAAVVDGRLPTGAQNGMVTAWIEAGDDTLDVPGIQLIPRLAILDARISVIPPAYTKLPPSDATFKARPATVWADSQIRISFRFNKPVQADAPITLEPVGAQKPAAMPVANWDRADATQPSATWRADQSVRFRVKAKDLSGFENAAADEFELIVRPDQPPAIQIENPRRAEERTLAAIVPLDGIAEDDLAISSVSLRALLIDPQQSRSAPTTQALSAAPSLQLVGPAGPTAPGATWTSAAAQSAQVRQKVTFAWPLAQFPAASLKVGDVIEYYLEAHDSFALDGQSHPAAQSQHLRITLISEQDLIERVTGELRSVAQQIGEVKKAQDRLGNDTDQLKADLAKKPKPEAADQQVADRISQQQSRLSAQTGELAARLGAAVQRLNENGVKQQSVKDASTAAQKLLSDAADGPMRDASRQIKDAVEATRPADQQRQDLDNSRTAQRNASDQLKKAVERLGDFGGLQQLLDRVRDLLEDQRSLSAQTNQIGKNNLGKTPEQMSPADRKALDDAARRQDELATRTASVLDQLRATSERTAQADPTSAQAMRQAADTGQSQAVSSQQKSAAGAMRQNQQSQAQSSQKSAEMGLEMMLSNLREAERRKLEELTRKLAEMAQQLEQLRQRQAGHNLDNLLLQDASQVVSTATTQPVKDLMEKAHRPADSLVKSDLRQLTASQQQTHLNTSDLSKSASSLQEAEELGDLVNKAAGRMERAMVLLRQEQLKPAYDPQAEALAALDAALAKAVEMKQKADDQSRRRQQEEVRKVLQEIRKQQVEIDDQTRQLDKALASEPKKRADLIRLNQVAAQEGTLAEKMVKVGGDLADLGSALFQSVAKDVRSDMQDVSSQLSKQVTGEPTQNKQLAIVRRLDAMIKALYEEPPKEDRFAQRSQGGGSGGGGGGGRKLPRGAELKLLRELQSMVNVDTQAADAAKAAPPQLTDLSQRQGSIRQMLDDMLKKATGGTKGLGEEKPADKLPEENTDVADDLDAELLTGKPITEDSEPTIDDLSKRMTRSRVRLADRDAGAVTQKIQKRLLQSMDELIQKAQQQQSQASSSSSSSSGKQAKATPSGQKPGGGEGATPGSGGTGQGSQAASESKVTPGAKPPDVPLGDIRQTAREWGSLSARDRQAVIDSSGEDVVEKYRKLVEDYYRSLSEKSSSERR